MTRRAKAKRSVKSGRAGKPKNLKGKATSRSHGTLLVASVKGVPPRPMLPDEGSLPPEYEDRLDEAAKETLQVWFK